MTPGGRRANFQGALCRICGEDLDMGARTVRCAVCDTPHHSDCWVFNGQCALYGCGTRQCLDSAGRELTGGDLLICDELEPELGLYRLSGGLSGADAAHLSIVLFPLLWLPAAVEGGLLLAVNLLFVAFPLLIFLFQVRSIAAHAGGLELGYLLWTRGVSWDQVISFRADPLRGYALGLADGAEFAIPAQPGELRELETFIHRRLRERPARGRQRPAGPAL